MTLFPRLGGVLARLPVLAAGASVLMVLGTLLALAAPSVREAFATRSVESSYAPGDTLELEPAVYADARRNVFLFARASCKACQASKGIMAGIVSDLADVERVRVTFVTSPSQPENDRAFALAVGVEPTRILDIGARQLRLRYVPSVVVTDDKGTIVWLHEGILTESNRTEIVETASDISVP